jgi:chemotaxis protein CheX
MRVEFINPFVKATVQLFRSRLGCELARRQLLRKTGRQPHQEVSGLVEVSGQAHGAVVWGLARPLALRVTEVLRQASVETLNEQVQGAIVELVQAIVAGAREELEQLELQVGPPRVVIGRHHTLPLDGEGDSIDIVFDSPWGVIVVEVGLAAGEPAGQPECAASAS